MVYGCTPPPLFSYGKTETTNSTIEQQLKERDVTLTLKEHLKMA